MRRSSPLCSSAVYGAPVRRERPNANGSDGRTAGCTDGRSDPSRCGAPLATASLSLIVAASPGFFHHFLRFDVPLSFAISEPFSVFVSIARFRLSLCASSIWLASYALSEPGWIVGISSMDAVCRRMAVPRSCDLPCFSQLITLAPSRLLYFYLSRRP